MRAQREFGAAIVRIDISNAFGVCARHLIAQALNDMTEERNLQAAADVAAARAAAAADRPAAAAAPGANAADASPDWIDAFMLKRYFNTIYGSTSAKLAVYGPSARTEFVEVSTGVRKGDVWSSYFFSLVTEIVRKAIPRRLPHAIIRIYADDLTISVPPQHARLAWFAAMEELAKAAMTANVSKPSILRNEPDSIGAY